MNELPIASVLEKMAEIFVKEFIQKYRWLEYLCEKHGTKPMVLQGLLTFLEEAPNLIKEQEAVSLGLVLNNEEVKLLTPHIIGPAFHISKVYYFSNLKDIVNGQSMCYVINDNGMATIKEIPPEMIKENPRETLQFLSHAFHSITIYLEGSNTFVYSSGELAQIRRNGNWMPPCTMSFEKISADGFDCGLLSLILRVCCNMSEANIGGVFVVSREANPKFIQPMNEEYAFEKRLVSIIPDNELD